MRARARGWIVGACAASVLAIAARVASADVWFVAPMDQQELQFLLRSVGATAVADKPAVAAAHAEYIASMDALRRGAMQRFLAGAEGLPRSLVGPPADRVAPVLQEWAAVRAARDRIENALFDAIGGHADGVEVLRVQQARTRRARIVTGADVQFDPAVEATLGNVADVVGQWPDGAFGPKGAEIRQACDAIDAHAATGLLERLKSRVQAFSAGALAYANDIRSRPVSDDQREGQDAEADSLPGQRSAFEEAFAAMARAEAGYLSSNAQAMRLVERAMEPAPLSLQREFRDAYLEMAHPRVRPAGSLGVEACAARAIRAVSLSGEQRQTIRQFRQEWMQQDRRWTDALIDLDVRLHTPARYALLPGGDRLVPEADERWRGIEDQRTRAAAAMQERLLGMLNDGEREQFHAVLSPEQDVHFVAEHLVALDGPEAGPPAESPAAGSAARATMPEPQGQDASRLRIDRRLDAAWMQCIAAAFRCDAAGRQVLDTLRDDYWKAWDEQVTPREERLRDLSADDRLRSEEDVVQRADEARQLAQAQRVLDEEFFEDVAASLVQPGQEPILDLVRMARVGGEPQWGLDAAFDGLAGGEENANVPQIALSIGLDGEMLLRVAQLLSPSRRDIEGSARHLRDMQDAAWLLQKQVPILWERGSKLADPGRWGVLQRQLAEREAALRSQGRLAAGRKAQAQRRALEAVLTVVPAAARPALEARFLHAAYPTAFLATDAAAALIQKALALPGLNENQRVSLHAARDEFERERAALAARLVALVGDEAKAPADGADGEAAWRELSARLQAIEQLSKARDAARDRVIAAVRAALDPSQQAAIGLAPVQAPGGPE